MPRQQSYPIRAFKPVSRLEDTTDKGVALEQCRNIVLRPQDGWSGPPIYNNLWAIGVAQTAQATYRALTFSGYLSGSVGIGSTGTGSDPAEIHRNANKTVAIQIKRQGKNFLLLYDLTAPLETACRGWFYLGDDGTYTSGDYAFTTGTPTYTVLAVGLNAAARWYGYPNQGAWFLGNGVDDNVIVQLGRTATPGIWRKAGTNAAPTAPVVSLVAPETAANTQASFTVPGYTPYSYTSSNTLRANGIKLVDGMVVFQAAVALPTPLVAATSYYVKTAPTTGTFTIAAATPAGSAATVDITDTGTGPFAIASTAKVVTASGATNRFTRVAHGLVVGDGIKFSTVSGTHSLGVIAGTKYFVESVPSADTFTISATRGGAIFVIPSDGSGTFYYSNEAYSAASVAASGIIPGTIVRTVPHNLAINDAIVLTGGTVPTGTSAGTTYYVHSIPSATTFTIKTTMVGTSALSITSTVAAGNFDYEVTKAILTAATNDTFTRTAHNIAVDDKITYSLFGSALTGITAGVIYFIYNSNYDAETNSTTFQLSLRQTTGAAAISISGTAGIESHRLWTINGSISLTVTALAAWKAGVDGNGCFKLAYNQTSGTVPFSSTLGGTGTAANPYEYIVSGGTTNTFDQFVAYVAADPLVTGLISISASASSSAIFSLTTAGFTFGHASPYEGAFAAPLYIAISKGVGSGASEGYTSRTVTVHARYWDAGHNGHGYEGPSSAISNTLIIPNTANNDISITVTPAPTAEGGRFGNIRLYMQFGEDADAVYKLVTPSTPVANVTPGVGTTVSVTVGTTTVFGEDDMSADQQRPLAHKFHAFAAEQMFRGGLIDHPDRLYASKIATVDEVAPEGCSLLAADYETISIPGTPAGSQQVTALIATAVDLQIHTLAGFAIINPVDPAQRVYPASTAGAISQSAVTIYEGKSMYYWAADLQLRTLDTARPADFTSTVATSQFAALGALELLREYIDTDAILRQPDRTWVFPDAASQHIWMFAPGLDGTMVGFAFDLMGRGMVGPFDWPKIYASAQMEPGRPEIIFADEAGRLFVWDTSAQSDSAGNAFGSQSAFTPHATGDAMGPENDGFGYVDYDHDNDGTASRFYKAHEAVLESSMLDMGQPGIRKAFQAILWRIVQDSRAFVEASFIDLAGNVETFRYGDVNDGCNCRASLMLSDSACRVKLRIIGAEGKKWAMRDLILLFAQQGQI
jgi:hypothetical protein